MGFRTVTSVGPSGDFKTGGDRAGGLEQSTAHG